MGSAPLVAFAMVATFILAMGAGSVLSSRVRHPWRVEAALAAYHALWLLLLPALLALNGRLLGAAIPLLGGSGAPALLGALYTAPPAFLLGVTLPVIVEARGDVARPYRAHALGAAIGLVAMEALLYPRWGVPGGLAALALAHVGTSAMLFRRVHDVPKRPLGALSAGLVLAGVATGAFQGGWLLAAVLALGPHYWVQPMVVGTMLLGLALGSTLWLSRRFGFGAVMAAVAGATGLSWLGLVALPVPALGAALLLAIGAVPIGMIFPAFLEGRGADRAQAGGALLSLSLGNAIGILLGGGLIPSLAPVEAGAVITAVLAIVVIDARRAPAFALVIPALLALALGDTARWIRRLPGHRDREVRVDAVIRGPGELSAIYSYPAQVPSGRSRRLYQTGLSPIDLDRGAESLIAIVGAAYAKDFKRALVIGAGSGLSAGTAALFFEHVDVIDLGSTVPALVRALARDNFDLARRPNARLLELDGVLAPYTLAPGYDLIVLTVDPGYHAKAAKLYALESLLALRGLLAPGGVLIFWSDSDLDAEANQVLINTGAAAFAHQKLFTADNLPPDFRPLTYYFLVHGDAPLVYDAVRLPLAQFFDRDPEVSRLPIASDAPRLLEGRAHPTVAVHRLAQPAQCILLGGDHEGPVPFAAQPVAPP